MTVEQLPTLPGKVAGIVGWDPCVLQCRACGSTTTQEAPGRDRRGQVATFIMLSGYKFHTCEGRTGMRRCPTCLASAVSACPDGRCKW